MFDVDEAAVILAREAGCVTTRTACKMLGDVTATELLARRRELIAGVFEQRCLPAPAFGSPVHAEPAASH